VFLNHESDTLDHKIRSLKTELELRRELANTSPMAITFRRAHRHATRARLRRELPRQLSDAHRPFLSGPARAQPDWSLLQCPHADQLPALRWKLANLSTFKKRRPQDFIAQADALDAGLAAIPAGD